MKVQNMTSSKGNKVANQFTIITEERIDTYSDLLEVEYFQSYSSVIARKVYTPGGFVLVELDEKYWDYSTTTGKYRNQFLGETKKETLAKIKSGQYKLVNLNG